MAGFGASTRKGLGLASRSFLPSLVCIKPVFFGREGLGSLKTRSPRACVRYGVSHTRLPLGLFPGQHLRYPRHVSQLHRVSSIHAMNTIYLYQHTLPSQLPLLHTLQHVDLDPKSRPDITVQYRHTCECGSPYLPFCVY